MSQKIRRAALQFAFAKPTISLSSLEPFAQVLILRVRTPPHRRGFFYPLYAFGFQQHSQFIAPAGYAPKVLKDAGFVLVDTI